MTPEIFEKRLRQLEKRLCCLQQGGDCEPPTLLDRTSLGLDDELINTIQFDNESCSAWYVTSEGVATIIECESEPCTFVIQYSISNTGFTTYVEISSLSRQIYVASPASGSTGNGSVQFVAGEDVNIRIGAGNSIWSYSLLVEDDGNELINESESNVSSGPYDRDFPLTPECGHTYTITINNNVSA